MVNDPVDFIHCTIEINWQENQAGALNLLYFRAMPRKSAGILMYRKGRSGGIEVLLVHPGGPYWKNKEAGAWSIPKGEFEEPEEPLKAAIRETYEEIGHQPKGQMIELHPVRLKSGKIIHAWATEDDFDPAGLQSNDFEMEWPPRSGTFQNFPEVDRAEWFELNKAKEMINSGQLPLLIELSEKTPK